MCTPKDILKHHASCNTDDHQRWNRRSFMQTLGLGGIGATLMVNGIPMAYGQPTPLTNALSRADNGRIIILVRLQGGNDGLNTIVPVYDYDRYANYRPTLRHNLEDIYRLSSDFGMPGYLQEFMEPIWEGGCMKVVHGTGYEDQNLSHFTGTDNMSRGIDDELIETGVYGRHFESIYPDYLLNLPEAPPAVQIGGVGDFIFTGSESNYAFAVANTNQLERIASSGELFNVADVPDCTRGSQLRFVRGVLNATLKYSGVINEAAASQTNTVEFPDTNLGRSFAVISRTIKANMGTCVYMVNLNGFDTHANQPDAHQRLLTDLTQSVSAFYRDLEPSGRDNDVLTMTFSEFGRRVRENGSNGTDHGTAAPMLLFGPSLNGSGFIGEHPNLRNLTRGGNLRYTQDYINVYGTIMEQWLCIDPAVINQSIPRPYTSLDLGFTCSSGVTNHDYLVRENFEHMPIYEDERVSIRINNNFQDTYEISLFNILGQKAGDLYNDVLEAGTYDISITDQLPQLTAGVYIYNINKNNRNYSKKIIIGG